MQQAMKILEIKAARVSVSEEFPGGEALQVHTNDTRSDVSDQRVDVWKRSAQDSAEPPGKASQKRDVSLKLEGCQEQGQWAFQGAGTGGAKGQRRGTEGCHS